MLEEIARLEIAKLYESGEKSNRIKADHRIRTTANDYDLQDLVKILQDQQASMYEKMVAALSIGYHEESGNHELVILYEALKDARGEPRTYAYRVLSGIRKLLSKNIQCDNMDQYYEVIEHYKFTGSKNIRAVANDIYFFMSELLPEHPKEKVRSDLEGIPQDVETEVFRVNLIVLKHQIAKKSKSDILTRSSFDLIDEIIKIDRVGEIDPEAAIAKARKVIEIIITDFHVKHVRGKGKNLHEMIETLYSKGIIPQKVYVYLDTVRKVGNLSVHYQPNRIEDVTLYDVKLIGMITARIVEWYITSTI